MEGYDLLDGILEHPPELDELHLADDNDVAGVPVPHYEWTVTA